jgi:hypothetical protein
MAFKDFHRSILRGQMGYADELDQSVSRTPHIEDAAERARRLDIYVRDVEAKKPIQYIAREVKDDKATRSHSRMP